MAKSAKTLSLSTSTPNVTGAELTATIQELEAKLNVAKQARKNRLYPKVSAKGAVSVYGLGRWPTTLYRAQWEKILDPAFIAELRGFIEENADLLSVKS
jgi:hypothetical protein